MPKIALGSVLTFFLFFHFLTAIHAHPVPRENHDRKIILKVQRLNNSKVKLSVNYRLEVDEFTVLISDMQRFANDIDLSLFQNKRHEFYGEYTRLYAPIFADKLKLTLDGQSIPLKCSHREHALKDDEGKELGHLRCDFVFATEVAMKPNEDHDLLFRESNFELLPGKIELSVEVGENIQIRGLQAPSKALLEKTAIEYLPGEEEEIRTIKLKFFLPNLEKEVSPAESSTSDESNADQETATTEHSSGLLQLGDYNISYPLMLLVAIVLGAAHALTPGHGKTLVAAYLVGENGTIFHALVLGLVTTFTHTIIVFILAMVLYFIPSEMIDKQAIQSGLGLAIGIPVVCLGFWLLMQRLRGGADHIHIGGGHHHHHHGHHHHHAHDHEHTHDHEHGHHAHDHDHAHEPKKTPGKVGWIALITLGLQGGIVPCWDAVGLLGLSIAGNFFHKALPILFAFSAGLAGVLVLIGILVVKVKGFASSRFGDGRWSKALAIVSALIIILMGFWFCYDAVHNQHL